MFCLALVAASLANEAHAPAQLDAGAPGLNERVLSTTVVPESIEELPEYRDQVSDESLESIKHKSLEIKKALDRQTAGTKLTTAKKAKSRKLFLRRGFRAVKSFFDRGRKHGPLGMAKEAVQGAGGAVKAAGNFLGGLFGLGRDFSGAKTYTLYPWTDEQGKMNSYGESVSLAQMMGTNVAPANPPFPPGTHNSDTNYFEIQMPTIAGHEDRASAVTGFLSKWMKLNPKYESINVSAVTVNGTPVNNRFLAEYTNRRTNKSKNYYFTIDFQDAKQDAGGIGPLTSISITNINPSYSTEYQVMLNIDCRAIQARFYNPDRITCVPVVNEHNYVVPHAYRAHMTFVVDGKEHVRERLALCVASQPAEATEEPKVGSNFMEIPDESIFQLIKKRIKTLPDGEEKVFLEGQMASNEVRTAIEERQSGIDAYQRDYNTRIAVVEKDYQEQVRVQLASREKATDEVVESVERTYKMMRQKTRLINAFNIRTALRLQLHRLRSRQNQRVVRSSQRIFQREMKVQDLLERMDAIRYERDRKLDEEFEKSWRAGDS